METGNLWRSWAKYSRKPETSTSRQRMTTAGIKLIPSIRSVPTSIIKIDDTSSLSATGSRNLPNGLIWSHCRAINPSRKSVIEAHKKRPTSNQFVVGEGKKNKDTMTGISTIRLSVKRFGMLIPFFMAALFLSIRELCPIFGMSRQPRLYKGVKLYILIGIF